ncbi:MAG: beta-ketoacyl synthase N-terminal-like domain-containing protein [Planctomycetota bacterium]
MTDAIVITGCGAVAPKSLIPLLSPADAQPVSGAYDIPYPGEVTRFDIPETAPSAAFEIDDFDLNAYIPTKHPFIDRASAFALAASAQALSEAGLLDSEGKVKDETGCCYGTAFGCLETMAFYADKLKTKAAKFAPPLPFTHSYPNSPSALASIQFGLKGHSVTMAGGNNAGINALATAVSAIKAGRAERVLVVASDALSEPVWKHLYASRRIASRPPAGALAVDADGCVPSEGGAAFVIETESSAKARGARIIARLSGYGFSTTPASSEPFDAALSSAWSSGLKSARVRRSEVDVISLSSPQCPGTDAAESAFIGSFESVVRADEAALTSGDSASADKPETGNPSKTTILFKSTGQTLAPQGAPALTAVKLWGGEMLSASPLSAIIASARLLDGAQHRQSLPVKLRGVYRPGEREALKLIAIQSLEPVGTAAVVFVSASSFI